MSMAVLTALRTRISSSNTAGGFAYVFDGRVYATQAPSDCALPVCVYEVTTDRSDRTSAGYELVLGILFRMYDSADTTGDLASAQTRLKALLDGWTATLAGHDRVTTRLRRQGVPQQDDDAWLIEDEYELRATLL